MKKVHAHLKWLALVALLLLTAKIYTPGVRAQEDGFVFTAHGDLGPYDSPEVLASLSALSETGAAFSLGLGDLSYESVNDEQRWCETVQHAMGSTYPFEIVLGNHEDEDKLNGYIGNFVRYCPDHLNARGIYGAEYYFDYPAPTPLVRVIMIGADNDWDWNGNGSLEENERFKYDSATPAHQEHLAWLVNAIDSARDTGIPWVVVGMHKNCLTVGAKSCEIGPELMNLLVEKKVDLILQGHDHTYQRSKQLALGPGCAEIQVNAYNSDCVVDDGTDGNYSKGAGSVLLVTGHFGGRGLYDISLDDPEASYFVKAMGRNGWVDFLQNDGLHSDVTKGFVTFDVNENRIIVTHVSTSHPTTFSDSFVIGDEGTIGGTPTIAPTSVPSTTPTPLSPDTLTPGPPSTDAPTTLTLTPVADGYVNHDEPDSNFGSNIAIRTDASPELRSYLRFDTQTVSGTVMNATLRIYANSASTAGYDVYTVSENDWTESGLTYSGAPDVETKIATSGAFEADTWVTVDVTAWIPQGGSFVLALITTGNTAVSYSSREGANPPELIIEYSRSAPTESSP